VIADAANIGENTTMSHLPNPSGKLRARDLPTTLLEV